MNLRELKYVIYGDDRLSGKLRKISGASDKTANSLNRTSNKLGKARAGLKGVGNELPFVGRGMAMLASPAGIAAAGVLAVGAALNKGIDEAAEFNSTFRELQNMNLGKTRAEIASLKSSILDLSFDQGFDANKASTGFYDVQSITGKYGAEVEAIVAKQGKFAQVMKASFNDWIAGSAKAMANYGFGADELDRYNASAAATIQVGVTTYDQYAKVSSVFAGAASAAKQSYDSSNKLFALFTKKTKTVDEAATLVKSAFIDLFKESSIDAFKKVGIDLFDVNGKAKQVDQIMKELNARFAKADSDKAMTKLRNEFKGSEGLIALIQTASDQSGDMLRAFESFDNNDFSFNAALKEANKDLNYINETINGKLKVAWISLGESVLPLWIEIKKMMVQTLEGAKALITDYKAMLGLGDSRYKQSLDKSNRSGYDAVINDKRNTTENLSRLTNDELMTQIQTLTSGSWRARAAGDKFFADGKYKKASELPGTQRKEYENYKGMEQAYKELADKYRAAYDARPAGYKPKKEPVNPEPDGIDPAKPDGSTKKGLESVSGGGARVRNINVDIGKLVETLSIEAATVREGAAELRDIIQEELVRAVSGFEQTIS